MLTDRTNRKQLFSHPNIKKTKEIDNEINDILLKQHISDHEKNEQLNFKFSFVITKLEHEALLGKPSLSTVDDASSVDTILLLEGKFSSIPESHRLNAKKLTNILKSDAFSGTQKRRDETQ